MQTVEKHPRTVLLFHSKIIPFGFFMFLNQNTDTYSSCEYMLGTALSWSELQSDLLNRYGPRAHLGKDATVSGISDGKACYSRIIHFKKTDSFRRRLCENRACSRDFIIIIIHF